MFKIFVANPNKTKPVLEILQKNKDKLIAFLTQFHTDKGKRGRGRGKEKGRERVGVGERGDVGER